MLIGYGAYFCLFQSNITSAVSATAAPVTTSGQNNTNSSNTTLPSRFTATAGPISVTKLVTKVPIKPPKDRSSEEILNYSEKPERGSKEKKKKRGKGRKRERVNFNFGNLSF